MQHLMDLSLDLALLKVVHEDKTSTIMSLFFLSLKLGACDDLVKCLVQFRVLFHILLHEKWTLARLCMIFAHHSTINAGADD
ncbi:hypothetical protein MPTK1_2g11100 [Marchantia polymorpha subsp. ruderalis]|uniref:Uncharacterized protein n=1 Tax=Marchantia polymorpha TaxID=3197 RepID=A0A2R6XCC1_MARPO|nr:hypothetical protein MARPO_0023s0077 [Marchantia polymorpha]BBN01891.1 hypothetical protein Mp_2g11100 [Marchantia polymorpha subsp. ruderalis]|eukprot:PTQ43755.1 hypothetical protein MARPO_0023s0077 [Marchantia polymorpha]